jgi:hypothetical protein
MHCLRIALPFFRNATPSCATAAEGLFYAPCHRAVLCALGSPGLQASGHGAHATAVAVDGDAADVDDGADDMLLMMMTMVI